MADSRIERFGCNSGFGHFTRRLAPKVRRRARRGRAIALFGLLATALLLTLAVLAPPPVTVTSEAFAQDVAALEHPAAMRRQDEERSISSQPYRVRFDKNVLEHRIRYDDGHFEVLEGGVYVISASTYISGTTQRRIEVRVYDQNTNPEGGDPRQAYVLEQTQVTTETQHNSTVTGTISLKVDRGDRISIWVNPNNATSKIAASPNSNWVSICQINRQR